MNCETETITKTLQFSVEVEYDDSATLQQFGPVCTRAQAESLLLVLAGRTDVKKATIVTEEI